MMRCLAIDDSSLALDLLEDYIGRVDYLHLVKRCQSALEAGEILRKENIDLIFLDIQMPDITGIDLLKSLSHKPKVIFTTAYPNYAIEGFNLSAIDYLLKPFSFERFKTATDKAFLQLKLENSQVKHENFIFIKSGYDTIKIRLQDIIYIEAQRDYIQIFTKEKKIMTLMSMKDILNMLPPDNFARIHRSFIVAIDKISGFSGKKVFVETKEIPVGDIYRKDFQKLLKEKKIIP
ncbi:MAG: LytR/AlgR family response regulator transcription factor [Bacteroidia bacterium]